jgi:hypothetical protein
MSYADAVSRQLAAREMSIKDLATALGRSYEHCRRIVGGESVASERLNEQLCKVLGLDRQRMWTQALNEKVRERYGVHPRAERLDRQGKALMTTWRALPKEDRAILLTLAKALRGHRSSPAVHRSRGSRGGADNEDIRSR